MERRRTRILAMPPTPPPRRGNPVFTFLLVVTGMLCMAMVGFGLGRFTLAKKMLKPSEVHAPRPEAIRILTPDEARAVARDEASHVWTQGVKPEDIPKTEAQPGQTDQHPRRRHRPTTPSTDTPATDTQPAPDSTTTTTPDTGAPDANPPSGDTSTNTDIPND